MKMLNKRLLNLLLNNQFFNITARIFSVVFIIGSINYGADEFYVFNVGQGNCNLFIPHSKDSGVILYDAGWSAMPFDENLNKKKVTSTEYEVITDKIIDIITQALMIKTKKHLEVVVSHSDKDHLNLLEEIVEAAENKINDLTVVFNFGGEKKHYTKVNNVSIAAKGLVTWVDNKKYSTFFAGKDHKFPKTYDLGLNKFFTERILSWETTGTANIDSIVLRISPTSKKYSILLTGDGENDTFDSINEDEVASSTVMVASHHGANTEGSNSEKWIAKVKPKHVVFSSCSNGKHRPPELAVVGRYLNENSLETTELHVLSVHNNDNDVDKKKYDQLRYLKDIQIGGHQYPLLFN